MGEGVVVNLRDQLKRDEGLRLKPYRDTVDKLTIGYGRNLDDVGIRESEADFMLANDIQKVEREVTLRLPWTVGLDEARRAVFVNMAFNMGIAGLLGFKNTLAAASRGDWPAVAAGMRASKWATQVKGRAERLAQQIETGEWQ